jgi:hypothetical protein
VLPMPLGSGQRIQLQSMQASRSAACLPACRLVGLMVDTSSTNTQLQLSLLTLVHVWAQRLWCDVCQFFLGEASSLSKTSMCQKRQDT